MTDRPGRINGKRKRPGSVTAISVLYWFNAVATSIGSAIIVLMPLLLAPSSERVRGVPHILASYWFFALSNPWFCGYLALNTVLVLVLALAGWGLWRLRKWGRYVAIAGSSLIIVLRLVVAYITGDWTDGLPSLIFHGLVLSVLFRKHVRAAFEATPAIDRGEIQLAEPTQ